MNVDQIVDQNSLIGLIIRVPTLIYLISILISIWMKYNKGNNRNKSTKALITTYVYSTYTGVMGIIIMILQSFISPMPALIYYFCYAGWLILSIIACVCSLIFVMYTFTSKPTAIQMKTLYILSGISIGMILCSVFSNYDWVLNRSAPDLIVLISALIIFIPSFLVAKKAKESSALKTNIIYRMQMIYYYRGAIIFARGMSVVIISTLATAILSSVLANTTILLVLTLIMENLPNLLQVINTHYTFVALFPPEWFNKKYSTMRRYQMVVQIEDENKGSKSKKNKVHQEA